MQAMPVSFFLWLLTLWSLTATGTHFDSLVFIHLMHTGGSSISSIISQLCSERLSLKCVPTYSRKSLEVVEALPNNSIDVLYGHFEFDPIKVHRVMKGHPMIFTVVRDAYEVFRSSYFYSKVQISPSLYARNWTVDAISTRLGGIRKQDPRVFVPYHSVYEDCGPALAHLREIHLIVPYPSLLVGMQLVLQSSHAIFGEEGRLKGLSIFCTHRLNSITAGNPSVSEQFDDKLTAEDKHHVINETFYCAYKVIEEADRRWAAMAARGVLSYTKPTCDDLGIKPPS